MRNRAVWMAFVVAVALYGISFILPVMPMPFGGTLYGWGAFLMSVQVPFDRTPSDDEPFAFLYRLMYFSAWLANPAAWLGIGCWLARKWKLAFGAGYVGLLLPTPLLATFAHDGAQDLPGPGCWVWLSSFVALIVASRAAMVADVRCVAED